MTIHKLSEQCNYTVGMVRKPSKRKWTTNRIQRDLLGICYDPILSIQGDHRGDAYALFCALRGCLEGDSQGVMLLAKT